MNDCFCPTSRETIFIGLHVHKIFLTRALYKFLPYFNKHVFNMILNMSTLISWSKSKSKLVDSLSLISKLFDMCDRLFLVFKGDQLKNLSLKETNLSPSIYTRRLTQSPLLDPILAPLIIFKHLVDTKL